MKKHHMAWFWLPVLLLSNRIFAQADSTEKKEKAQFRLGVYYNTNLNYFGRTDSLRSSGVFPLAELWFGQSFYINAAPVFVNNKVKNFDYAGTVTTVGYRFTSDNKKMGGSVYLVKPFYKDNSQLVQSALKAQGAVSLSWLNKIINLTGGVDIKFSDKTDFGATGGADHIFKKQLNPKAVLVLIPSFYIYAGTQRFTETYYKATAIPGITQLVTENTNRFTVLSYEISMPVVLGLGKLQLLAIPAYVLPQNLINVSDRPDLSERGENLFYATLGIKMNF